MKNQPFLFVFSLSQKKCKKKKKKCVKEVQRENVKKKGRKEGA